MRLDNFYYVDKTRFIQEIEASNEYFFFIRPRRFGKSLLMNMLRQYYDLRKADRFDRLFGDLWIGSHPTPTRFSSQRDKQKSEAYVHGFTLAQTCLTDFYLPVSKLDAGPKSVVYSQKSEIYSQDSVVEVGGYADIYLQPRLGVYPEMAHSYVLELKYLPGRATDAEVAQAREKAIGQITRYAEAVAIERTYKPTTLHRLVLLWRGMELAVAEEI